MIDYVDSLLVNCYQNGNVLLLEKTHKTSNWLFHLAVVEGSTAPASISIERKGRGERRKGREAIKSNLIKWVYRPNKQKAKSLFRVVLEWSRMRLGRRPFSLARDRWRCCQAVTLGRPVVLGLFSIEKATSTEPTRKMEVPNRTPNICALISLWLPSLVHV